MDERCWRIGELARATGLTVRTLHHFDEIALLRPSRRTPAGHRLYTGGDVRRLYRVLALRQLGIPLAVIADSLADDAPDLAGILRRQLDLVQRQVDTGRRLGSRLSALLAALRERPEPSIEQLLDAMEAMMPATYFTSEQLTDLRRRHAQVGAGGFARWRSDWAALVAQAETQRRDGLDPAAPAAQDLARRWDELMMRITGGDRTVLSSMYAKMDGEGPHAATRGLVSADAWDHVRRAMTVGFGGTWDETVDPPAS